MPATNGQNSDEYARKSGQPFDIVEPAEEEVKPGDGEVERDAPHRKYLGFLKPLNPIPPLKELLERIFPSD